MLLLTILAMAMFVGGIALNFFLTVEAGGVSWSGQGFPVTVFGATAAVMFAGIVFGCLYRSLKDRSGDVHLRSELASALKSAGLLRALCVSPFVFMVCARSRPARRPSILPPGVPKWILLPGAV